MIAIEDSCQTQEGGRKGGRPAGSSFQATNKSPENRRTSPFEIMDQTNIPFSTLSSTAIRATCSKEGHEIDVVLTENGTSTLLLESRLSDDALSKPLIYHKERFVGARAVRLVHHLRKETHRQGIDVVRAGD